MKIPSTMESKSIDVATYEQNQLPDSWIQHAFDQGWFKLFVPKAYHGLECSLPDALDIIRNAGTIHGSLGWCINLGAGAGFFSGFFSHDAAKKIFSPQTSALAGSGMNTGTAIKTANGYTINGHWGKCTGAAHASHFTLNAVTGKNEQDSFIIERHLVDCVDEWPLFALKATSSININIHHREIPSMHRFTIGHAVNPNAYAIHRMEFMAFARYCMMAAYLGLAQCFLSSAETLLSDKNQNALNTLKTVIHEGETKLIHYAEEDWVTLVKGDQSTKDIQRAHFIGELGKEIFNQTCHVYYNHGMLLSDERTVAHHAFRDVMLASQHFLLKVPKP